MAKSGRPMAILVEPPVRASKNVVVTAQTFHLLFLKGLRGEADFNRDKVVSLGEPYNYLARQVQKIAGEKNMERTPVLLPAVDLLGNRAAIPFGRVEK